MNTPHALKIQNPGPLDARRESDQLVLHTRVVSGSGGGPDKTILNSPRFLADEGYPMVCAYMRPPDDELFGVLESRATEWHAPLVALDDSGPLDLNVYRQFVSLCEQLRPAIWHGHDYKSNALGCLLQKRFGFSLITTVHGWVKRTWKTPLYYAIDRYTLQRHDHVICVSEDLLDAALAAGVPKDKCSLIHNAIDTEYFRAQGATEDARVRLGLPADATIIGGVGRLSKEKAFDILIHAFSQLDSPQNLHLCIAGEGDEMESLQALIHSLNLEGRVHLLGFVADTRAFYEAIDVYALSSLREGLPNVLLEAMAMEVPLVSTNVAGIPSLVNDGTTGLLVDAGSPEPLAGALSQVLADETFAKALATAARGWIEQNYSFAVRMQKIKAVYESTPPRTN